MSRTVVMLRQAMPYVPGDRPYLPDVRADALVRTGFARELTEEEFEAHSAPASSPADKRVPASQTVRK